MPGDNIEIELRMVETADNKSIGGWILIGLSTFFLFIGVSGEVPFAALVGVFCLITGIGLIISAREDRAALAKRLKSRGIEGGIEGLEDIQHTGRIVEGEELDPAGKHGDSSRGRSFRSKERSKEIPDGVMGSVNVPGHVTGVDPVESSGAAKSPGAVKSSEEKLKSVEKYIATSDEYVPPVKDPETVDEGGGVTGRIAGEGGDNHVPALMPRSEEVDPDGAASRGVGVSGRVGFGLSEKLGIEIGANVGIEFAKETGVRVEGSIEMGHPEKKGVRLEIRGKDAEDAEE